MKFLCPLLITVAACSAKRRGVVVDDVIQPPGNVIQLQREQYSTLLVGERMLLSSHNGEGLPVTIVYDKKFFKLQIHNERMIVIEAVATGKTLIEREIKDGDRVVARQQIPILIVERGSESTLSLTELLELFSFLPRSLSMTYLGEQTLQLVKLPDSYRYQFVDDSAGFTILQASNPLTVKISANAVGESSIAIGVIDRSRAQHGKYIIDTRVDFQESYQLQVDTPFLIQMLAGDWQLEYDHTVVNIVNEDDCSGKENCLAKYILTVKEVTRESLVIFRDGTDEYRFTVKTDS